MLWVESLRWTSHAEVCDQLAQFLFQTSTIPHPPHPRRDHSRPASVPSRSDVAHLLALIADTTSAPALRRLVDDPAEEEYVRTLALQALARLQADVPLGELLRWLDDRSLWEEVLDYCYLTDLISLF